MCVDLCWWKSPKKCQLSFTVWLLLSAVTKSGPVCVWDLLWYHQVKTCLVISEINAKHPATLHVYTKVQPDCLLVCPALWKLSVDMQSRSPAPHVFLSWMEVGSVCKGWRRERREELEWGEWYISHIALSQGGGETDPHISMSRDSEREKKRRGWGWLVTDKNPPL